MSKPNWDPLKPREPLALTPEQFERRVNRWIGRGLKRDGIQDFSIKFQGVVSGDGGDYKIDALIKITLLRGAETTWLVECKHQHRPVSRDDVLILEGKLRDAGAHKGMLFATSGFQDGAIRIAKKRGIACVVVTSGAYIYRTKDLEGIAVPPSCIELPDVVGLVCRVTDDDLLGFHRFDDDYQDGLLEMVCWLLAPSPEGQRV